MDLDPQRESVHAAITTAEHRSLGNVLDVIRRLEELRSRGLSSTQIAERIRLTHPNRPGGGPWSAEAVDRVLEIADAARRPGTAQPSSQVTQPIPTTAPERPAAQATHTYPPPIERPTPAPAHHPDRGPGRQRNDAGRQITGPRPNDHQAPLRVEPRRYHQRPTAEPGPGYEPEHSRRWPAVAGFLTLVGLVAVGFGLYQVGVFDRLTGTDGAAPAGPESTDATAASDQSGGADDTADDGGAARSDDGATASGDGTEDTPDASDNADPDTLVVRIEPTPPETDGGIQAASATIRTDGKLYIEGAFRSDSEAQSFLEAAADVFGEAALVPSYTVDPAAPDPTVSDVVLEKPVLFTSGSAEIDPEYIPFLEACGDVLKLNSHIVMSVSAFTDASGSAEFNLELSQQRADAVIDFYRSLDIGDDQLISTGFGESDFVADNDTEEGRQQNRRAMLELLNVMSEG